MAEPGKKVDKNLHEEVIANTTANEAPAVEEENSEPKLSKNALKRLRRKEKFDKVKVYRRKQEREKRKQRYADAREQGIQLGPTRKTLKRNLMQHSNRSETIVIDCDFDQYMAEKDIIKLVNQIQRCYSINRRMEDPVQFHVTSVTAKTKHRLESVGDYHGWDVKFTEKSYLETFEKDKIVYLSSDSDQVLTSLKNDEVYIIGGLVDHNHHKGLCQRLAEERGVRQARLPIDEYIKLQSRRVLTIDQVFNILTQFLVEGNWESAFFSVIPKRKGLSVLEQGEGSDSDGKVSAADDGAPVQKLDNNDVADDDNKKEKVGEIVQTSELRTKNANEKNVENEACGSVS